MFDVNQKDGKLKPTGEKVDLDEPICIVFVPAA
jgi:6-phosphogluconolactonase (cycloisomerase 2 family)